MINLDTVKHFEDNDVYKDKILPFLEKFEIPVKIDYRTVHVLNNISIIDMECT